MKADSTSVCLLCEHTNASFLRYIATRGLYPLACTLSPSSSRLEHQRRKLDMGDACNILINVHVSRIFTSATRNAGVTLDIVDAGVVTVAGLNKRKFAPAIETCL